MNLGKLLFRRLPEARRRKEMQSLGIVLVIVVVLCILLAGLIYMLNKHGRI